MLDKILDVGHTRSTTGAIWFYVLSLTLLVGISTTLVHFLGLVGVVDGGGSFFVGSEIYTIIGSLFVLTVSGLILTSRKLTSDIFSVLLTVVAVYLAYETSVILGLIPVALLTTIKK
ncbi:MAG: hypothetical protein GW903_01480 [Alphaproteobacteria bacterium]|nr:hypothetical protein [Alphaproteobacteria bacterium]NCQ87642.1 hypothetical protein [Alphaproteobacteria bacterium]NCT05849.1 hypothetical protein [Alphaproteobacteria bacterium]